MKRLLFAAVFFTTALNAHAEYNILSTDASHCQNASSSNQIVHKLCPVQFQDNDQLVISGIKERSNLLVTNGEQNGNPYYMAPDVANANYGVEGEIQIINKKDFWGQTKRHALIYKLAYERYDGSKGYQIQVIRLANGRKATRNTCPMASYDVTGATIFEDVPLSQREQVIRQAALQYTQTSAFSTNPCMKDDHSHEERRLRPELPVDPDEGDSLESEI